MKTTVFHKAGKRAISLAFALIFTLCLVLHSVRPALAFDPSSEDYIAGYDQGVNDVYSNGYNQGLQEGRDAGYQEGYNQGQLDCQSGHDQIYQDGYNAGYDAGKNEPPTGWFTQDDVNDARAAGYLEGYEEGQAKGYQDGFEAGKTAGYEEGYTAGYNKGKEDGHAEGYDEGYDEGHDAGYAEGKEDGHTEGYDEGYAVGFEAGKAAGREEGYDEGYQAGEGVGMNNALAQFVSNSAVDYTGKLKATENPEPQEDSATDWRYVRIRAKITNLSFTLVKHVEGNIYNEWVFPSVTAGQIYTLGMTFECFAVGAAFNKLEMIYTLPATGEITSFRQFRLEDLLGGVHIYFEPQGVATEFSEIFLTNSAIVGKTFYVVYSATLGGPSSVPGEETPFQYYYAYAPVTITADMVTEINAPFSYAPKGDPFGEIYDNGYWAGYDAADAPAKMAGFLPGIFGGVTKFFAETLGGMTIFGISALDVFLTFIMIALVSFVIRFVK